MRKKRLDSSSLGSLVYATSLRYKICQNCKIILIQTRDKNLTDFEIYEMDEECIC